MRLRNFLLVLLILAVTAAAAAAASGSGYHFITKIAVGGDGGWDYLNVDGAAHRLYVSRSTRVMVVDTEKNTVVGEIPNTPGVHGAAIAPKLGRGFTSNGGDNSVTVFDLKTLKELAQVTVGTRPDAIVFDPATNRVFTFNGGSQDSTVIDAATSKVVGTIPWGGRPEFAVTDGKGRMFVNIEDKSEIVEFDPRSLIIKHRWSLAPGEGPSGLAMDVKNHRLFAVCSNEKMVIIDSDNGRIIATPTIGKGADAAAFDPKTRLVFSSNGADGTLTVIHEDSPDKFSVIQTVPTQVSARTMALDPKTHRIYLAAARFATSSAAPSGPPWRRSLEPNSFVILVFGE